MQINPVKIIVRCVLVTPDKKVLITKRSTHDDQGALEWDIPGGAVEVHESPESAAVREGYEETGIILAPENANLVYATSGDYGNGLRCLIFYVFLMDAEPEVVLSDEHEDYTWLPLTEAANRNLFQNQQHGLQYIQQNVLAD